MAEEEELPLRLRLNSVIRALDEHGKGFITVEDMQQWASTFGDQGEVQEIIRSLDPEGRGRFDYEEFKERVKCVFTGNSRNGYQPAPDVLDSLEKYHQLQQDQLAGTKDLVDGQEMHVSVADTTDSVTDTKDESVTLVNADNQNTSTTDELNQKEGVNSSLLSASTNEEGFVGMGEDDSMMIDEESDKELTPARLVRTPSGRRVGVKLLTRAKVNGTPSYLSRKNSTDSQASDDNAEYLHKLNDQILHLTSQLEKTEKQCSSHSEALKRTKIENSQFVQRCNYLEEQLSESRTVHASDLAEEKKKHKAYVTRLEADRDKQIESLHLQIKDLNMKCKNYAQEISYLKGQQDLDHAKATSLQEKNDDLQLRFNRSEDSVKTLEKEIVDLKTCIEEDQQVFKQVLHEAQEENNNLQRHYDEAKDEIERLTLETKNFVAIDTSGYQNEIKSLQRDIQKLREANSRMQKTYLDGQLQRVSLDDNMPAESLAAELEFASKDELMEALKQQEDTNSRMRTYLDSLLAVVMEKDPTLLEITNLRHHQRLREENQDS
ncbi:Rab11 family-interacting protein 3 [Trichoplax sp. H2]|uniref:EF-hand domain-containing protein n=1 Tax=Trichoplax adhaerens TaxID=10228 RepID=B3S8G5_TRIAD|nr:hypothetical protein TRIADDRAFT_60532 [Trichoplax adhaerens]EDV20947.1 hypothetical protein TRIADDRAFT_60532 [Trichoplax adhaerens]RDD41244.1 Rab11 family-interacting protein 3 [Trichoplax sp. H2]|eukprot:XP_002116591.1 hypothetical protein TRIADDRAFT_60532 [Trichoplax adhaerens]